MNQTREFDPQAPYVHPTTAEDEAPAPPWAVEEKAQLIRGYEGGGSQYLWRVWQEETPPTLLIAHQQRRPVHPAYVISIGLWRTLCAGYDMLPPPGLIGPTHSGREYRSRVGPMIHSAFREGIHSYVHAHGAYHVAIVPRLWLEEGVRRMFQAGAKKVRSDATYATRPITVSRAEGDARE